VWEIEPDNKVSEQLRSVAERTVEDAEARS
jgi:hypothetical protein